MKELLIRFTVRDFRERLSIFVHVLLLLLVFRVGCDCINSQSLPFYLFNSDKFLRVKKNFNALKTHFRLHNTLMTIYWEYSDLR